MTDLEMTKLCAGAMGYGTNDMRELPRGLIVNDGNNSVWDPLHDDAQAMALVKKLRLDIEARSGSWYAWKWDNPSKVRQFMADQENLNRAIVECAVKIQTSRT